jgi:hypothetical protein
MDKRNRRLKEKTLKVFFLPVSFCLREDNKRRKQREKGKIKNWIEKKWHENCSYFASITERESSTWSRTSFPPADLFFSPFSYQSASKTTQTAFILQPSRI